MALLSLALAACAGTSTGTRVAPAEPVRTAPLSIVSREGAVRHTLRAELAETAAAHERGYQGRTEIPADTGMLFIFTDDAPRTFWMKDTPHPLDILFVAADGSIVALAVDASPCAQDPCPVYRSGVPARFVLELPAGTVARRGIRPGDRVEGLPTVTRS